MKADYFHSQTIDKKSAEMLRRLKYYRKVRNLDFIPQKSALIVIDMQRYFLDENSHAFAPSAVPVVAKITQLAKVYKERSLPVIYTRHINTKEDAKVMAQWWADLITEEDELSEIFPELDLTDAVIVRKTQYDAFYNTSLDEILREKDISQVVITGVLTHLCCETTVRSAFVRGYKVFFPIDGTATYNEDFHWATFLNISHGFAVPVRMEEIQNRLEAV